jgi:helix-turn-helix protein
VTHEDIVYDRRVRLIEYAARFGNVAEACRVFGVSRSSYYEWFMRTEKYSVSALLPKDRRKPHQSSHRYRPIDWTSSARSDSLSCLSSPSRTRRTITHQLPSVPSLIPSSRADLKRSADRSPRPAARPLLEVRIELPIVPRHRRSSPQRRCLHATRGTQWTCFLITLRSSVSSQGLKVFTRSRTARLNAVPHRVVVADAGGRQGAAAIDRARLLCG